MRLTAVIVVVLGLTGCDPSMLVSEPAPMGYYVPPARTYQPVMPQPGAYQPRSGVHTYQYGGRSMTCMTAGVTTQCY